MTTVQSQSEELPRYDLAGKVALVTGASSGIGVAIARTMAAAGARLVLVGRDADRLGDCADAVRGVGAECAECCVDLKADDAAQQIVAATSAAFGRIDCLVNNAGLFTYNPFEDTTPEELDELYLVNVRAPYAIARAALSHLSEKSAMVFVSSNLAEIGMSGTSAYSATKGAVHALSRALSIELAPRGIRVNTVAPGFVRTPMTWRLEDPEAAKSVIDTIPAARLGRPADIAGAVAYLCSDAADYVTGAVLTVDGGLSAY